MKTLAIRLEDEQHAQLTMIAQLEELNITAAIRQAIDQWIEAKRSNPKLQQRAEAVLAEIEQDATNRRATVTALLNGKASVTPLHAPDSKTPQRPSKTKGGSATS